MFLILTSASCVHTELNDQEGIVNVLILLPSSYTYSSKMIIKGKTNILNVREQIIILTNEYLNILSEITISLAASVI